MPRAPPETNVRRAPAASRPTPSVYAIKLASAFLEPTTASPPASRSARSPQPYSTGGACSRSRLFSRHGYSASARLVTQSARVRQRSSAWLRRKPRSSRRWSRSGSRSRRHSSSNRRAPSPSRSAGWCRNSLSRRARWLYSPAASGLGEARLSRPVISGAVNRRIACVFTEGASFTTGLPRWQGPTARPGRTPVGATPTRRR